MDRALRNVMQYAHWGLQNALRLATVNPARVAGVNNHGVVKEGAPADLVVRGPKGEVRKTIVRGAGILASVHFGEKRMADKWRFPHYMIKEIFDQAQVLRDTIQP